MTVSSWITWSAICLSPFLDRSLGVAAAAAVSAAASAAEAESHSLIRATGD